MALLQHYCESSVIKNVEYLDISSSTECPDDKCFLLTDNCYALVAFIDVHELF